MYPRIMMTSISSYYWAIRVFGYFIKKYWPDHPEVCVAGFSHPQFDLPERFSFHSMGDTDWPADKWTDQVIGFLNSQPDRYWMFVHEDYWIYKDVDSQTVSTVYSYIQDHNDILRVDLSSDRLNSGCAVDHEKYNGVDLIKTPAGCQYQMSHQWGMWNKERWLELLVAGEIPQDAELRGSQRLAARPDIIVLGTRQHPIRYIPTIIGGKTLKWNGYDYPFKISDEDIQELRNRNWLPEWVK